MSAAPFQAPPADHPASLGGALRAFAGAASPRILGGVALACVAARLALGSWSLADLGILAVLVALWPLQEWLIHVFILHFRPRRIGGRTIDFAVPRMHRAHHRDPWRLDLIFIPLRVYLLVPLAAGAVLLWAGDAALALSGLAVYFALALHYEWVHFLVHTRYRPRSRRYRRLWENHRLHHFKNEHYWYGVTMLSGDRLLHTAPDRAEVDTSPTCRTLGVEEDLGATA